MSIVKLNNRAVRSATEVGTTTALGSIILIKKLTASSSATLSFVDGSSSVVLDNTYKEYLFTFNNIHPGTNSVYFQFQGSTDSGSSYGVTATTSLFRAYHNEAGDDTEVTDYSLNLDQSTNFQSMFVSQNDGNDESCAGYLRLFNPSDTTFVKHFMFTTTGYGQGAYNMQYYGSGYFNTTSAIDAVQFKESSGNIDAGDICLYGIN